MCIFQDRGNVYRFSLGTIQNCLRHPDVIPTVKQMNIVPHVAPFLDKRSQGKCKDHIITLRPSVFTFGLPFRRTNKRVSVNSVVPSLWIMSLVSHSIVSSLYYPFQLQKDTTNISNEKGKISTWTSAGTSEVVVNK